MTTRLKAVFDYCDGRSISEIANFIDRTPDQFSALHQAAMWLCDRPEYAIGGESDTSALKGDHGTKEAY